MTKAIAEVNVRAQWRTPTSHPLPQQPTIVSLYNLSYLSITVATTVSARPHEHNERAKMSTSVMATSLKLISYFRN